MRPILAVLGRVRCRHWDVDAQDEVLPSLCPSSTLPADGDSWEDVFSKELLKAAGICSPSKKADKSLVAMKVMGKRRRGSSLQTLALFSSSPIFILFY